MKNSQPIWKLILQLVVACLLLVIILFTYLSWKKQTHEQTQLPSSSALLTPKTERDYQLVRQELFTSDKISAQYQGKIVILNDPLTNNYLINILKNATYTANNQALRYPEKSDLVFNLGQNRLIIIGQVAVNKFNIDSAYVLYEKDLLSEQLSVDDYFATFLYQLLNKHFTDVKTSAIGQQSERQNNLALLGGQTGSITNYLEKFRLKTIALPPTWPAQLIINENSQLSSSAPHNAKLVFTFSPAETQTKFYLNYQPYNWLGKNNAGPTFNFNERDYQHLITNKQLPATGQAITIANTKGFITHQLVKINQSENHLMRIAYFPFYYYYLSLSADLGQMEAVDEQLISELNSQKIPAEYQSTMTIFNNLINSLVFMDKQ